MNGVAGSARDAHRHGARERAGRAWVLGPILKRDLDLESLEEKAQEIDRLAQQLHEAEVAAKEPSDLHYIG